MVDVIACANRQSAFPPNILVVTRHLPLCLPPAIPTHLPYHVITVLELCCASDAEDSNKMPEAFTRYPPPRHRLDLESRFATPALTMYDLIG